MIGIGIRDYLVVVGRGIREGGGERLAVDTLTTSSSSCYVFIKICPSFSSNFSAPFSTNDDII